MIDLEYYIFSQEDPIEVLKDRAATLTLAKKRKVSPYINRAAALLRKSDAFREALINADGTEIQEIMATSFILYFDKFVDKGRFVAIAKDPAFEFIRFISGLMGDGIKIDDKYLRKVNTFICQHSREIDAFVKAFLSIRIAQGELNRLTAA